MQRAADVYFGPTAINYESERTRDTMWQREAAVVAPVLRTHFHEGDMVLDVAAGTGRWLELYAAAGVRPVLLDISCDMLAIAQQRAQHLHCAVEVVEGNVLAMAALPRCAWLLSTRFFNWISAADIARVLGLAVASGIGRIAFTVRCLDRSAPLSRRLQSRLYWHRKNLEVLRGIRKKGIYHLHSLARLRRMAARAGLETVATHVIERVRGDVYLLIVMQAPGHGPGGAGAAGRPSLGGTRESRGCPRA